MSDMGVCAWQAVAGWQGRMVWAMQKQASSGCTSPADRPRPIAPAWLPRHLLPPPVHPFLPGRVASSPQLAAVVPLAPCLLLLVCQHWCPARCPAEASTRWHRPLALPLQAPAAGPLAAAAGCQATGVLVHRCLGLLLLLWLPAGDRLGGWEGGGRGGSSDES